MSHAKVTFSHQFDKFSLTWPCQHTSYPPFTLIYNRIECNFCKTRQTDHPNSPPEQPNPPQTALKAPLPRSQPGTRPMHADRTAPEQLPTLPLPPEHTHAAVHIKPLSARAPEPTQHSHGLSGLALYGKDSQSGQAGQYMACPCLTMPMPIPATSLQGERVAKMAEWSPVFFTMSLQWVNICALIAEAAVRSAPYTC